MRVLIIDSSGPQGETLCGALVRAGHDAIAARTPREAWVLIPRFLPHIVVSELFESDTDDYGWWRKLCRHSALAEARFIAALSGIDAEALPLARDAGFDYVLAAPVDAISLDEYLVGVSSAHWRRNPAGIHPRPGNRLGIPVAGRTMPDASGAPCELDEAAELDALERFLRAMREQAEKESGKEIHLLGAARVPPVAQLRHLDTVRDALDAARGGDALAGRQILQDGLTVVRATVQPWADALRARYELALRTYAILYPLDGLSPR